MNISRFILIVLMIFKPFWVTAQNISVKSFQFLPHDQTARVHHPVLDQNGEKCALVKVVTTRRGFVWEGGTLGITDVTKKTGEYWVYVPQGSKKLTIKHDQLGVLRDYQYPQVIKSAMVYEMALTTGKVTTIVEQAELPAHWVVIQSEPREANVLINGKLAGRTPFQRKYKQGEYDYRVTKALYHPQAGKISIKDGKKVLSVTLKPHFGHIHVTSEPEKGIPVYLDYQKTDQKTPATFKNISSGEHTLQLQSDWYQPVTRRITVKDEDTSKVHFQLEPAFANVSITCRPRAEIMLDDQYKGTGFWTGRLLEGIYTIEVRKEKYVSQNKQIEVLSGQDKKIHIDLQEKTGTVDILTMPIGAMVYYKGKKRGTTPLTLKDLSVGDHKIRLQKAGYAEETKHFTIETNNTITVEEQLAKQKSPVGSEENQTHTGEDTPVYVAVDDMPTFNGQGLLAFKRFVQKNIDYPVGAVESKIEGTVHARFIIDTNGAISDITIQKGVHPILNKQVKTFLENAPSWQPGKQNGEPVGVSFTLPVAFKLVPYGF